MWKLIERMLGSKPETGSARNIDQETQDTFRKTGETFAGRPNPFETLTPTADQIQEAQAKEQARLEKVATEQAQAQARLEQAQAADWPSVEEPTGEWGEIKKAE